MQTQLLKSLQHFFFYLVCPFSKSNFIKMMDNTLNKIVARQLLLSNSLRPHC